MLGMSTVEIIHGIVTGAAMFFVAIWDAVAASPKLQAVVAALVVLSLLSGGAGGRRASKSR